VADQDTNWTWNFSGPTTESKAQSRAILPREIAWELTGVDGNEVGGLRTHPGFKQVTEFQVPSNVLGDNTVYNVFPINILMTASTFVTGHIFFTNFDSGTITTKAYLRVTADGTNWYTSSASADLTWTGGDNEITVECMGKFAYIFVRGQSPKTLMITSAVVSTASNFTVLTGGPGTAPVVKVISTSTADGAADYADSSKNPAGSRTSGSPSYPQEMHVYRAGGANSTAVAAYGTGAAGTVTVSGGIITAVSLTNFGSGYIFVPTVSFPAAMTVSGSGGSVVATTDYNTGSGPNNNASWHVSTLTIATAGSGYVNGTHNLIIGGDPGLTSAIGTPVKLKNGAYSFAVQYMSTTTGRKSVISNVQTLTIGVVPSATTAAASTEEYVRLKVFKLGVVGEYDKALIYRTVKDSGEGGALHLEKTLGIGAIITTTALASNVVTITTAAAHGFSVGDSVVIAVTNNTGVYNGTYTITGVTSTTFTYAKTNGDTNSLTNPGTASVTVKSYDVEIPDNQLVYLDVYIDKGIMDKTMPKGGVAGFMGSTLFVSRITGTDVAEPTGITPVSPPRSAGDMRWSSTGEIQPENFKPSNRWIPQTPGNEILGMQTVGNYMMAFSADRVYRIGRAGQFIKVEEVHMGYGLVGRDAIEGVGGMVYFVSGGGMKAISAEGAIEDVAGLDALINRLWLGQKSDLKMAYDAVGQCLTIMKPPTELGEANGAAVCMWFGTNRITELADLPFHFVRSGSLIATGSNSVQRRSFFYKRNSETSWGIYKTNHTREPAGDGGQPDHGRNLCGGYGTFYHTLAGPNFTVPSPTLEEFDCAMYNVATGQRSPISNDAFIDENQIWSMAPILFRWVGGNVGSQADPTQPEFKDFFKQKQLSSCHPYFETIFVDINTPSTYATWRGLAYRGTEEITMSIAAPTDRTGQVLSTFAQVSVNSIYPEVLNSAAFGKHGIMGSTLSPGFQCDIVGVDLRLLAFNVVGKVLDTTRRYV